MKIFFYLICIFTISNVYAQTGWQSQYYFGADEYVDIFFLNQNTGWSIDTYISGRLVKTTNKGVNWTVVSTNQIHDATSLSFINPLTGWASGSSGQLYKTSNGGVNWIRSLNCNCNSGDDFIGIQFINELTGWAFGDQKIFKTTDGGINYYPQQGKITVNNGMFIDSSKGWVTGYQGAARTLDGGVTWDSTVIHGFSNFLSIFFVNETTGWTCNYQGKIFKTTDSGLNWFEQQSGVVNRLNKICFIDINTGWIVGNSGLILKTINGGVNWLRQTSININNLDDIYMLNSQEGWISGKNYILHTTNGGGPTVEINSVSNEIPQRFSLSQNYPNPFNPTTTIRFQIKESSLAKLKIFNMLGREVTELVNNNLQAGSYNVTWDASGLPSGVYFYKLETENFSETKKMILLK